MTLYNQWRDESIARELERGMYIWHEGKAATRPMDRHVGTIRTELESGYMQRHKHLPAAPPDDAYYDEYAPKERPEGPFSPRVGGIPLRLSRYGGARPGGGLPNMSYSRERPPVMRSIRCSGAGPTETHVAVPGASWVWPASRTI